MAKEKPNPGEQEILFDTLNKAFKSHFWVIKYAVYPIAALLFFALFLGIWWGVDLKSAKTDVEHIQAEMGLKAREIELLSKDLQWQAKGLSDQFKSMESDFARIDSNYRQLQTKYLEALSKNEQLFKALQADNRSLSAFSETIKLSISKYTSEIQLAKQGAEQRKKDADALFQKTNDKLVSVQTSITLLTEYLALVSANRSVFPDPNIDREINILNDVLRVLVPDPTERSKIIKRINESTGDKKQNRLTTRSS